MVILKTWKLKNLEMRSVLKLNYLLYYFFSSQGDAIEYFILNKKSISSLSLSRLNLFLSFQLPNQSIRFYSIIFKLTFYQSAFSYLAISLSLLNSVWPDLAKFCHFGTIVKVLGAFLKAHLLFGKILILLLLKCFTIGQVFIVVDGQIL